MENSEVIKNSKAGLYFYAALLCSIWFLLTSYFWVYYINLVFSFPIGFLGLVFWNIGRKKETPDKRFKIIPILLILGLISSVITLIILLLNN